MRLTVTILLLLCLGAFNSQAQFLDCVNAMPICDNQTLNYSTSGPGEDDFANPDNDNGCLLFGEHQSLWLVIKISELSAPGAPLGFTLIPNSPGDDFDFAVYGPASSCNKLGSPIRCSYANATLANCGFCPETGVGMDETDLLEGATGNGFVSFLPTLPSEIYYILIDNFTANNTGFRLEWSGSAILDCDLNCFANAGTYHVSPSPGNQSDNQPLAGSTPPNYILCHNDGLTIISDENYTLPNAVNGEAASLLWAVYSSQPPTSPSPSDPNFTGKLVDADFLNEVNTDGLLSILPSGVGHSNNTIWIVPVTGDDGVGGGNPNGQTRIDGDGDECYSYGRPFSITYLNEIEGIIQNTCTQPLVQVIGGRPEIFGGTYTISGLTPANASLSNYSPSFQEVISIEGLSFGDAFSFTISDQNGCESTVTGVYEYSGPIPELTTIDTIEICPLETVQLTASTTFSGSDYEYTWTGPGGFFTNEPNPMLSPALEGRYTVSVIVDGCQSNPAYTYVRLLESPEIDPIEATLICADSFDLSTLNLTGSNLIGATFRYFADDNGSPGFPVQPIVNTSGTYWIEAIPANNNLQCNGLQAVEIFLGNIKTEINNIKHISCFGSNDGAININVSGGQAPYTYEWTGTNSTEGDVSGLSPGNYELTITDAIGCTAMLSAAIQSPDSLFFEIINQTNPSCAGERDGQISVQAIGGVGPYSYRWSNGANTPSINQLSAGVPYSLTITDANGCTVEGNDIILSSASAISLSINQEDPDCSNSNGSISLFASGGTGLLSYHWAHDTTLTSNEATNLGPGAYRVTISDAAACSIEEVITLSDNGAPSITIDSIKPETCFQNDGFASISYGGGTGNLILRWLHDSTWQQPYLFNAEAGTYIASVTDEAGCTQVLAIDIPLIAPPTITIDSLVAASCDLANDGAISINVEGGSAPYSLTWSHNANETSTVASGFTPGNHAVAVVDARGCFSTLGFEIGALNQQELIVDEFNPASCTQSDGSISLEYVNATEPVIYTWSHDSTYTDSNVANLPSGTYSIIATDANGCRERIDISLDNTNGPEISSTTSNSSGCLVPDGSMTLEVTGGYPPYTYQWPHDQNLNSPVANNLLIGVYTVTVTDANGCSNVIEDEVIFPTDLYLDTIKVIHTLCEFPDGEIHMYTTGGVPPYDYTWSHDPTLSDSIATGLWGGTYFITATDAVGCEVIDTVVVLDYADIVLHLGFEVIDTKDENCGQQNGEIRINIDENLEVVWDGHPEFGNATHLTNLPAGTYNPIFTTPGVCTALEGITINNIPAPIILIDSLQDKTCSKDTYASIFALGGSGSLSYQWSHDSTLNNTILSDIQPGDYAVTVSDAFGCSDSISFNINEVEPPVISLGEVMPTTCGEANGMAFIDVVGGTGELTFQWSHNELLNSDTARFLSPGIYMVTVLDEEDCEVNTSVEIEGSNAPNLTLVNVVDAICQQNSGEIETAVNLGTPPFNFEWSHDTSLVDSIATGLVSGAYSLTVTDAANCTDSLWIDVNNVDGPAINIDAVTVDQCSTGTGSILVSATGGSGNLSISWSHDPTNTSTSADSLSEGFYTISVEDENGCRAIETVQLHTSLVPEILLLDVEEAHCGLPEGSILVLARDTMEPVQYQWSHDSLLQGPLASDLLAGNYSLTVTNANGCSTAATFGVPGSTAPEINLVDFQTINCNNQLGSAEILVSGGTAPFEYQWSHNDTLNSNSAQNLTGGMFALYGVSITDVNDCRDSLRFNLPAWDQPIAYVDSIQSGHCNNNDGSAVIETLAYAYYRINSGNLNDSLLFIDNGAAYAKDSLFARGGRADFIAEDISNTPEDLLFQYRRIDSIGFRYQFPVPNGEYTIRLGFAEPDWDLASPNLFDVSLEGTLILDDFDVLATFGPRVAGFQEFNVTITDSRVDLRFDVVSGWAQVSTIEIIPVNQPLFTYSWSHNNGLNAPVATELRGNDYQVSITDASGCTTVLPVEVGRQRLRPEIEVMTVLDTCGVGTGQIALSTSIDPFQLRLNSGGPGFTNGVGQRFRRDNREDGNGIILTTDSDIANTNDDPLYQAQRSNAQYQLTVPNGMYEVVLHFAEPDNLPPDSTNMFNIELEDKLYDASFDIIAAAGAFEQAYTQSYIVSVTDGALNIDFNVLRGRANLAAIEILPYLEAPIEFSYNWSHDAAIDTTVVSQLLEGNYTITVYDNFGCSTVQDVPLYTTPTLSFEILDKNDAFCALPSGSAVVQVNPGNLIINGNFSAGNFGFETDYNFTTGKTSQGRYKITDDASTGNSNFDNCEDHSRDNSLFMLADGRTGQANEVWCQTLDVTPGIWYDIEAWATSVIEPNPAELQFTINDSPIGNSVILSDNTCEWQPVQASWQADTTQIRFCITNLNNAGYGNDFGLDDLSFAPQSIDNSYTWEHDPTLESDTASNLAPGVYYVSATDNFGCNFRDSIVIRSRATTEFVIAQLDRPGCDLFNGKAVISGAPLHRINVGGTAFISELTGNLFNADQYSTGGNVDETNSNIASTENDPLYQSFRQGNMNYNLPIDKDGTYEVVLHFLEPGQTNRIMNISLEGQIVENNFNILNETNFNHALIKRYIVNVNDGILNINLNGNGSEPILSAIEVYEAIPPNTDFSWSHNANLTGAAAGNLTRGDYAVTITEANGCVTVLDYQLEFPPNPVLSLLGSVEPAACLGVLGSAIVSAEGEPDFSYSWSHNTALNSNTANNLTTGIYTITVTDANNCKDTMDIQLLDLTVPKIHLDSLKHTVCSNDDGEIFIHATGGGGSYQFSWLHNENLISPFATDLAPGDYTVYVVDKNGCNSSETYNILPNGPLLEISSVEPSICDSIFGTVMVRDIGEPLGATTYSWSHDPNLNSPTATGLISGDYRVSITDENGCTDTLTAVVGNIDGPNILNLEVYNPDSCDVSTGFARLVLAEASGDIQYRWSHDPSLNMPMANNLGEGQYWVRLTDQNGCTNDASFEIAEPETFQLDLVSTQLATCGETNGTALVEVTGGNFPFNYTWSHDPNINRNIVDSLGAGTYSITVVDNSQCVDSLRFPVLAINAPTILTDSIGDAYCDLATGIIQVNVNSISDTLIYQWSHDANLNSNLATDLNSGNYSLTVTDGYNCAVERTFEVPAIEDPKTTQEQVSICSGEQFTYEGNVLSRDTTVCVTFRSAAGCDSTHCITLGLLPEPVVQQQAWTCSASEAGIFTDTLTNFQGCDSLVITMVNLIEVDTSYRTQYACNPNQAGTFYTTLTSYQGCDSIIVTNVELYDRDTTNISAFTCIEEEVGVFYTTFVDQETGCDSVLITTVDLLRSDTTHQSQFTCNEEEVGTFYDMRSNIMGCDSLIVTTVSLLPRDTIELTDYTCDPEHVGMIEEHFVNQFGCDSMVVTTMEILPKDTMRYRRVSCLFDELGTTVERYTNYHGCDSLVIREVIYPEYDLYVEVPEDMEVNYGDSVILDIYPNFNPVNIEWMPAEGLDCTDCLSPMATVMEDKEYLVFLQDENGCEVSASVQLRVNPICDIYIPNAFSPNGDGINDVFQIYAAPCVAEVEELMIFDRWGELVYRAERFMPEEVNFGWDGIFRGQPMNPAVFAWFTKVRLVNGEQLILKGDLTLMR